MYTVLHFVFYVFQDISEESLSSKSLCKSVLKRQSLGEQEKLLKLSTR